MNSTKKITIVVLIFLTLLLAGVSIFVAINLNNRNSDVPVQLVDNCTDQQTKVTCAAFSGKFVCTVNPSAAQSLCRQLFGTPTGGACTPNGENATDAQKTCQSGLCCPACGKCVDSLTACDATCGTGGSTTNPNPPPVNTTGVSCNVQGGPSSWNVSCNGNLSQAYRIVGYQCAQQGLSFCVPSNGGVPVTVSASVPLQGNPTPASFTATMSQFPLGECGTVQLDTLARSLDINNAGDITGGKVANLGSGNCATGGGGGATTPAPQGIGVGGVVVCQDPNADPIRLANVRLKITHIQPGSTAENANAQVSYVTTNAEGRFASDFAQLSNTRQFRVEIDSLPNGNLPNGQAFSSLVGPSAPFCNNSPELASCARGSAENRDFCGTLEGSTQNSFYRQCRLDPGERENNFRFVFTNCTPTAAPQCGATCTANSQCPSNHTCSNNRCVLSTCATDPSRCTADLCTLQPSVQCGGSCTTNSQCPNNHTCSNNRCVINQCLNNASCTNNGCTLPATALFDDQTDIILIGLLLVIAGLTVYKLNWHQVFYKVISKSDSAKLLLLDKDNALRKETEQKLEIKERNKRKLERMQKREGFEKRFGE